MANFRSLTLQSGITKQIQDADQLIVGAGITTAAGNLSISSAGGTTTFFDDLILDADKSLTAAPGTGSLDFSGASGIFKTTTGDVTIGPGNVTVSGPATFSGPGVSVVVDNDVLISGNLTVMGITFTTDSETVLIADNNLYLNNGYTTVAALTGGITVNYLPTALVDTVTGAYVAGVPGVSNPSVTTMGTTFAAGDLIQISSSDDNNGLFEVLSHAGNILTIRGIGLTACVEDFTQNQFVAGPSDGATVTKVNVSIIRAGATGDWEVGKGAVTPIVFSDVVFGALDAGINYQFIEGGVVLTTGVKVLIPVAYNCDITSWTLLSTLSGDFEIDIQKTTYTDFPAGFASIVAATPPTLSLQQKNFDDTLVGWTTPLSAGDILQIEVVGVPANVVNVTLQLAVRKN